MTGAAVSPAANPGGARSRYRKASSSQMKANSVAAGAALTADGALQRLADARAGPTEEPPPLVAGEAEQVF